MPKITVNGKAAGAGAQSPVVVIVRAEPGLIAIDHGRAVAEAEALVVALTGRSPSVWTDGTGTTVVTASQQPSARPAAMPEWDEAGGQPAVEHRGRPDGRTLYRKPTVTHLGFHGGMIADRAAADVRFALDDGDGGIALYTADIGQSELFRLLWPALRRADK